MPGRNRELNWRNARVTTDLQIFAVRRNVVQTNRAGAFVAQLPEVVVTPALDTAAREQGASRVLSSEQFCHADSWGGSNAHVGTEHRELIVADRVGVAEPELPQLIATPTPHTTSLEKHAGVLFTHNELAHRLV